MLEIWGLGNGCYANGEASFEILYHVISQQGATSDVSGCLATMATIYVYNVFFGDL